MSGISRGKKEAEGGGFKEKKHNMNKGSPKGLKIKQRTRKEVKDHGDCRTCQHVLSGKR